MEIGSNSLGHENVYLATGIENQIYGILVVSIGKEENVWGNFKLYFKTFNFLDALKLVFIDIGDMWMGSSLNEDDFYLASVAVDYKCRGKGIGQFILEKSGTRQGKRMQKSSFRR